MLLRALNLRRGLILRAARLLLRRLIHPIRPRHRLRTFRCELLVLLLLRPDNFRALRFSNLRARRRRTRALDLL